MDCQKKGHRLPILDRTCIDKIVVGPSTSGYCECEGGHVTRKVACAFSTLVLLKHRLKGPFTCAEECAALSPDGSLGELFPAQGGSVPQIQELCKEEGGKAAAMEVIWEKVQDKDRGPRVDMGALYQQLDDALDAVDGFNFPVAGWRTHKEDFVQRGERLRPTDVAWARRQLRGYLGRLPEYGTAGFAGRGIVMCGGSIQYMVPAWVSVHLLRRVGSTLPIEMWFLDSEVPGKGMAETLAALGVEIRRLGEICPTCSWNVFTGYRIKAAVLMFSRFREVVYMDSDNVALEDPTVLFESKAYQETGAVMWQDYWLPSVAPDFWSVTGMDPSRAPNATHESGQMVVDKQRWWAALCVALYFNVQGTLYWRLLTNYMGQGDKETFPMAAAMMQVPYHLVRHRPGSIGTLPPTEPERGLRGNTMVQYHPDDGRPFFLHTNMFKFALDVPYRFSDYPRRWQWMSPHRGARRSSYVKADGMIAERTGLDLEREAFYYVLALKCAPFFPRYARAQVGQALEHSAMEVGPGSFHWREAGIILEEHYDDGAPHRRKRSGLMKLLFGAGRVV